MAIKLLCLKPAPSSSTMPRAPTSMSVASEPASPSKPPVSFNGIPDPLSFDRIISSETSSPCTLWDFMNYLLYIERTAEHLQFFLWYRGYIDRFEALKPHEKALSPEWTEEDGKNALEDWKKAQASAQKRQAPTVATEVLNGTMFGNGTVAITVGNGNPFETPPATSHRRTTSNNTTDTRNPGCYGTSSNGKLDDSWDSMAKSAPGSIFHNETSMKLKETAASVAFEAFEAAGLSQPFTIQPFRKEVEHVIQTYFADGASRELNISAGERKTLLKALEATTHPSAFSVVVAEIEFVLRGQLHPNFIRWTICNGNRARVLLARGLGISFILIGILVELLLTLSNVSRGWRAFGAISVLAGASTLAAASRGMCLVLQGLHHRLLRPWELYEDEEDGKISDDTSSLHKSIDTVQSANCYDDAPWAAKYRKRNLFRRIFDREVTVQEPAVRRIHDVIFVQSILSAFLAASLITAIFLAIPRRGYL